MVDPGRLAHGKTADLLASVYIAQHERRNVPDIRPESFLRTTGFRQRVPARDFRQMAAYFTGLFFLFAMALC